MENTLSGQRLSRMEKLGRDFYNRDAVTVAEELLGKILIRKVDGRRIAAKVVETEAYMGVKDKAAHSYGGRRTPRMEVMYGEPGLSYVYIIYGIHHCLNIVTGEKGDPQAVLIRAVEPVEGIEWMAGQRFGKGYGRLTPGQRKTLTNGPGKLCKALSIDRALNGIDSCNDEKLSFYDTADAESPAFSVTVRKRVGIGYAEEAKDYLWRFYIENNPNVSVR